MKRGNKIIFVCALAISVLLHFFIFNLNPEIKYKGIEEEKNLSIHIVNAVLVKKPIVRKSIIKKPSKKNLKGKIIKIKKEEVFTVKSSDRVMNEKLVERKIERIQEGYEKTINPEMLRNGGDERDKNIKNKKEIYIPFYKVDKRPKFLVKARLSYPPRAKELGVEGIVILEVDIDKKGRVVAVRVVKRAGFGFDEAAVNMIKNSKFLPAYSDGRPVPVRMRFTIVFRLQ